MTPRRRGGIAWLPSRDIVLGRSSTWALCMPRRDGVPEDHAEAVRWYRMAAEQGNAKAQNSLGDMYYRGEGIPEDHAEAARWSRLAAEQGHAEAQYNLGVMYDKGEGVPEDGTEAARWYRMAAEQGHGPGAVRPGLDV